MTPEWLNVIAAGSSALAAFFAWWIALVSLRDSRRLAQEARRRDAQSVEAALQARLDPLYPGLRAVLGTVDDGVPIQVRSVLIPFFVLYADAFAAHRDGILSDPEWKGLGLEMANWAQREPARRAWETFRRQEWTDGFVEHVDAVLSGPAAYPAMSEVPLTSPTITWPDDGGGGADQRESGKTSAGRRVPPGDAGARRSAPAPGSGRQRSG